jgi:hypothetical protein
MGTPGAGGGLRETNGGNAQPRPQAYLTLHRERPLPVVSALSNPGPKSLRPIQKKALTKHRSIDLISYQNNGKCSTAIVGKVEIA